MNIFMKNDISINDKVYDVPSVYEYFYTKQVNGETRVWGAYAQYFRWGWDPKVRFPALRNVILFTGIIGKKIKYTQSQNVGRLKSYASKHSNDGYRCNRITKEGTMLKDDFTKMIKERYPEIHDGISKKILWLELQR